MTILTFTLILLAGAYLAGLVGSLTGLGGGVVVIPLLTLVFHVDIRYAIGAALLAAIANSSGAPALMSKKASPISALACSSKLPQQSVPLAEQ